MLATTHSQNILLFGICWLFIITAALSGHQLTAKIVWLLGICQLFTTAPYLVHATTHSQNGLLLGTCLLAVYHNSTVIWHTSPNHSQRLIVWHMTLFHNCATIWCMPPTHKIVSLAYNSCSSLHHYLVHGTNSWPDSVILGICWLFRTAQLCSIHLSSVPQHHY